MPEAQPQTRFKRWFISLAGILVLLVLWELGVRLSDHEILPGPFGTLGALAEVIGNGKLFRYCVASLFRITWGFLLAFVFAFPFGILLGWFPRLNHAFGPLLQVFRPISSMAWIPIGILWLGIGDGTAIFIISLACFGPLTVTVLNAVRRLPSVYVSAGRNFGLSPWAMFRRIVLPAILPEVVVGIRQSLIVAWMVVVMAEMIAVNSGLGFMIVDARNAGNRYDIVLAGMVAISAIGLGIEWAFRRLERTTPLRWGFHGVQREDNTLAIERRRFLRGP